MTAGFAPYGKIRLGFKGTLALGIIAAATLGPTPTQNAVANGETRTLTIYHAHTGESATVTFRRYGSYDSAALKQLNWMLRDWRRDEPTNMDPRLFDVLWETYRETGSSSPIRVVSAYRSPETNGMLRRRSRAVAKHSQHMVGKAMDFHLPDVSMARVREIGMRLQRGGVGYYPTANTPFVHLDVGSVRSWPRMPRNQLERLFPDGMTVHLPADGTPLANYQSALAMIQSRGGSAFSYEDVTSPRRSLWAMLFGGEDGELEESAPQGRGARRGRPVAARGAPVQQVAVAQADSSSVFGIGAVPAPPEPAPPVVAVAQRGRAAVVRGKPQPLDDEATPASAAAPTQVASLGTPALEPEKPALKIANVPVPPRRPAGLKEDTLIAAAVPMPPTRPNAFAETTGSVAAADLPSAIKSGPTDTAKLVAVRVPVPPTRPVSLPRGPEPKLEVAKAPDVRAQEPAKVEPIRTVAPKSDTAKLDALMASVVTGSVKDARPEKVPLPSVKQSMGSGIVASRMGDNEPAEAGKLMRGVITRPLDAGLLKKGD